MPIVSSRYSKPPRNNGRRLVAKIFHMDHNGDEHECNYFLALDTDLDQFPIDARANVELSLIEGEKYQVQELVEQGTRPEDIQIKLITTEQKEEAISKALTKLRSERTRIDSTIDDSTILTNLDDARSGR